MTFDAWWKTLELAEQRRVEKAYAIEAFQAGAASRNAEVADLTRKLRCWLDKGKEGGRASHTPGPWEIDYENSDSSGGGQWYTVGPAKVWFPYNCSPQGEEKAKADADLISAAPDLLEAVYVAALTIAQRHGPCYEVSKCLAAINKARGINHETT